MTKRRSRSRHAVDHSASRSNRLTGSAAAAPDFHKLSKSLMLLGLIGLVAFLLRAINVLQTVEVPTAYELLGDARGYYDWASRIAAGNWYGDQTFYQAPLYPYTLAVLMSLLGSGILGIRLFQALLGTISVFFVAWTGKRFFSQRTGLLAAALYATYPAAIYYDGIIQKTALASFLLCGLLAATAAYFHRPRLLLAALIGATLGLLVLTRENALLWLPLFPLWLWFGFRIGRRQRVKALAAYGIGLTIILFPVAARNASLGGEWSPTTFQAGPNFYIGNNLESNGVYSPLIPGHETPMYERADAQRLAEAALGRELSSREVSRYWAQKSLQEIQADPLHWLQLLGIKTLMVINRYEVPDVESLYVYRNYSWPLGLSRFWHFGILCPLAIWGLVVTRRRWKELWILYLLTVVMIAAVVLFFLLGRYRQPLVPLLAPFAAAGAIDIFEKVRQRRWRAMRRPLLASAAALAICNLPVHDESMLNASSHMNVGIAAAQAGKMAIAIESLSQAVEAHPEMAEANFNLAQALELTNRPQAAIEFYQRALFLDPNLVMVDARLGQNYERLGDVENAIKHYRRAVEIDPLDTESAAALQRLLGRGRPRQLRDGAQPRSSEALIPAP